jgi:type I restriction enzyme M protein
MMLDLCCVHHQTNEKGIIMADILQIEKRLWSVADNLRANSNFASNQYFLPVMGLIFLRHAYSRFQKVRTQ